jgi:hypothetical protein
LPANGAGLPMQQVKDWLEKLGMSEYAKRFAENDIDLALLAELTDQDLKELGVASLGHRRKILKAIAVLNRPVAAAALALNPPAPKPSTVAAPESPAASAALGRRAPLSHGNVLRSGRLDRNFRAA